MINNVVLVGRLTKDVELRKTPNNVSTCTFTLACNRRFTNAEGQQVADFINCVAWRQSADFLSQYASKGSIVGVEGRIQTRNYDGQNGKVYVTEIICDSVQLIGNKSNENRNNQPTYEPSPPVYDDNFSNKPSLDIQSDDLPFY